VRAGTENVCLSGKTGSDRRIVKPKRLIHNGSRTIYGAVSDG
jgi:hypothetical protein